MKTIVIGYLNVDLVASGIEKFPEPGELVYGKELLIGPGGKSRNIAAMVANLAPKNSVAMVGRTVKDPYGLWLQPMNALTKAGVNTNYVNVLEYKDVNKLPGIALIPVDKQGNNQIILLPGVNDDFSVVDIDSADPLFKTVEKNNGMLILTLECPIKTAIHAVKKANKYGLKVMLDPGGIQPNTNLNKLISSGIYLIKPNKHETKILTGIDVTNFATAKQAATILQGLGVAIVLITAGSKGAYLFSNNAQLHIPIPNIRFTNHNDETGCGDQTMAALCSFLQDGKTIKEASKLAVLAGTLQFHKLGIKPITHKELN